MTKTRTRTLSFAAAALAAALTITGCTSTAGETTEEPSGDGVVTIYLTRHGETILNLLGLAQGWSDSPLTDEGRESADDLGAGLALADIEFDSAYSGDMVRHFESASLVLAAAGSELTPVRDERLREMSFGALEGSPNEKLWGSVAQTLGLADLDALYGYMAEHGTLEVLNAISTATADSPQKAETAEQVQQRALAALTDIAETQEEKGGGSVLVLSSGITILSVLEALGGDISGLAGIENSAVSILRYEDGTWTVESLNDLSYVEAGAAR